jgi:hypothetical protein
MRFRQLVALPARSLWLVTGLAAAFTSCGDSGSNMPAPTTTTTAPAVTPPVTPSTTTTTTSPVAPTTSSPSVTPSVTPITPPSVTPTTSVTPPVTPPTATTTDTTPTTTATTSEPTSDTSGPVTETPTEVAWTQEGNTWSIVLGETLLEIDASTAGRITGYSLGGTQVIVPESAVEDDDENNNHYGSTFTLAPQADSGWPPPEHLDRDGFEASAAGLVLTMVGDDGPVGDSTLQLTKVFTANPADNSVTIDYQVTNAGGASATWAPWQVTRVPRNGITFFPTGTGSCTGDCPEELPMTEASGFSFWEYNGDDVGTGSPGGGNAWGDKWVGDGSGGWLAHAHDGVLLLLQFPDVAAASFPPGDGDIAIYASADAPYVEIEPEGAYAPIEPGATLSWKVKWSLTAIPENVAATPGQALGEFASGLVAP